MILSYYIFYNGVLMFGTRFEKIGMLLNTCPLIYKSWSRKR